MTPQSISAARTRSRSCIRFSRAGLLCVGVALAFVLAPLPSRADPPPGDWKLIFNDEFCCNGPRAPLKNTGVKQSEGGIDLSKWTYELGFGPKGDGWGNNEPQEYTNDITNSEITTDKDERLCVLAITARKDSSGKYTSARINTSRNPVAGNLVPPPNGTVRMEGKMWLPDGTTSGTWPAFWMLPADIDTYGEWPQSGEIDIMESGKKQDLIYGTIHFGASTAAQDKLSQTIPCDGGYCGGKWHVFGVNWSQDAIVWDMDGVEYYRVTPQDWAPRTGIKDPITNSAPFDVPFYLIVNLAVGGDNDISGQPSNDFKEQVFVIDYVRVYVSPSDATTGAPLDTTCQYEADNAGRPIGSGSPPLPFAASLVALVAAAASLLLLI